MSEKVKISDINNLIKAIESDVNTIDDFFNLLNDDFHYLTVRLCVARIDVDIEILPNIFNISGSVQHFTGSFGNGLADESKSLIIDFPVVANEKCKISVVMTKNALCFEDDLLTLEVFIRIIHVLMSRKRLVYGIKNAIYVDSLTGLQNSLGLRDLGMRMHESGNLSDYSCVFLNIKDFKYVNRRLGGQKGDEVLKKYSRQLLTLVGEENGVVARAGGNNFIILIRNDKLEDFLFGLSDQRINAVSPEGENVTLVLNATAGVFHITKEATLEEAMENASIAMNAGKQGLGDRVVFNNEMMQRNIHSKRISAAFPRALISREFLPYYQPKVELSTGQIKGCEALARWLNEDGLIPPAEFLPALEMNGHIKDLDYYILEEVCKDIKSWMNKGIRPVRVSVNYSKENLKDKYVIDHTIAIIDKYKIDTSFLEIELTETSGYGDVGALTQFIESMHDHGVAVAMDDFGTGYSSLSLFKSLQFDVVKLDKTFVDNINSQNRKEDILFKNVIHMLNELDMDIIVEGVETEQQINYLRNIKEDIVIQGYFFDKPMSSHEFEKRLEYLYPYKEML
ncbi:MAG: GGDEF domain-containing phosphodiesterase [Lachnospiraceae bacterium]|nr:GGDEF domain-containing phosphodiesterase [Lachnospiraceae bacterium]